MSDIRNGHTKRVANDSDISLPPDNPKEDTNWLDTREEGIFALCAVKHTMFRVKVLQ